MHANYKLDPCWYFTTPALSWDAMLLHTKVAIGLFTDYDMLLFIEKGVRGGISQCCNRYAIANNRYMSNFNPDDESDVGYILEVDLEYPSDLHDKHSDFPLAPENKPPPNCKEPRLLTTLEPKTKYVFHYSNLKLYLKLGCRKKQFNSPPQSKIKANAGEKQLNSSVGTKQLNSTGENKLNSSVGTKQLNRRKQLNSAAGPKQLNSSVGTKQLNSSVGTKQLNSALPSTACNRLQPPAPPAPPLQQNRLFLPTCVLYYGLVLLNHFSSVLLDFFSNHQRIE
ncbi:uncharacterized protein TNCV_4228271 [Trichonephila clavipes]|nr:uncharacterized protein TNCV_4228271 [Trichonephila clavipes]